MFLQIWYIVYEFYYSYLSLNWVKMFILVCPKFNIYCKIFLVKRVIVSYVEL